MHRLLRRLSHSAPGRQLMVTAARARRGRFSPAWTTPLHASEGDIAPFLIIGSGRSGNTLLRAMLHMHPRLAVPPEAPMLGRAAWFAQVYRHEPWTLQVDRLLRLFDTAEFRRAWKLELGPVRRQLLDLPPQRRGIDAIVDAIYRFYMERHVPASTRWGDKTPLNAFYLPWIAELFPRARYIHMLRDGRDSALSHVRAGLSTSLEAAADRWCDSVRNVLRLEKALRSEQFLEVRYERLVAEPAAEIDRICEFLGEEPHPAMLEYWREARNLGDTDRPHLANVRQPITKASVGKWRDLPPATLKRLESRLGGTLRRAGYTP